MVYFQKIGELLKPQRQSDLLAPQQPGSPNVPAQGQNGLQSTYMDAQSAGNRAEEGQSAAEYTKINPQSKGAASRAIFDANKNATAADISTDTIAKQQTALQSEADKYTKTTVYTPKVNTDQVLASSNDADLDALGTVLNTTVAAPKDYAYNNGQDSKSEEYVKNLNTLEGRQTALRQQNQSSDYNETASGIDALLLGQSQGFKDQQSSLVNQYKNYDKAKADAVTKAKSLQERFGLDAQAEKDSITAKLSGAAGAINSNNAARFEQTKRDRQAVVDREVLTKRALADTLNREHMNSLENLKNTNPNLRNYIDSFQAASADKYIKAGSNNVVASDSLSAEQASRFNKINSLLGRGNTLTATSTANQATTFDESGLRADIAKQMQAIQQGISSKKQLTIDAAAAQTAAFKNSDFSSIPGPFGSPTVAIPKPPTFQAKVVPTFVEKLVETPKKIFKKLGLKF